MHVIIITFFDYRRIAYAIKTRVTPLLLLCTEENAAGRGLQIIIETREGRKMSVNIVKGNRL